MRKFFSLDVSNVDTSVLDFQSGMGPSLLSLPSLGPGWSQTSQPVSQNYRSDTVTTYTPAAPHVAGTSGAMASGQSAESVNGTGSANWTTVAPSSNQDIDGLLSGTRWTSTTITYSFPTTSAVYGANYAQADRLAGFSPLNAAQQDAVRYALSLIASYTGITFVETSAADATLRYGQTSLASLVTADATGPGSASNNGDVWLGTSGNQPFYLTPQMGNWGMATIMRETGLAMGLKLAQQGSPNLPGAHDGWDWSVMTDRSDPSNVNLLFEGGTRNQPHTYMQDDIAALQYMYGANFNYNSGDNVYSFTSGNGNLSIDGVSQGTPTSNRILRTIWDGGGIDTFDFSNFSNVKVDLAPGAFSTISTPQLVNYLEPTGGVAPASGNFALALQYNNDPRSLIENAIGGFFDDEISGNAANNRLEGGHGYDTLAGKDGDDTLIGGAGDDILYGGAGNDQLTDDGGFARMYGGLGDDVYFAISGVAIVITEYADEGTDTLVSNYSCSLGDNVENLNLEDGALDGYGNALNNSLLGNGANNRLEGLDGDDVLKGASGNDTMVGGIGNDTYYVKDVGDVVVEGAGAGIDLIVSEISYVLPTDFENLTLILNGSGTGNASDNVIKGSGSANSLSGLNGDDRLDGGGGNDTLTGGQGNDSYYVDSLGDQLVETGTGTDAVFTTVTWTLAANFENLTLLSGNINGTGNSASNQITGSDGNNAIDGLGGSDIMMGGAGDDTYSVDSLGDFVSEAGGGGYDLIRTTVNNYILNSNVEDLTLLGTVVTGTGNSGDNALLGNSLNNVLNGGGGNDTLTGGLGNDTLTGGAGSDGYSVDSLGDVIVEVDGEGNDFVVTTVDGFTLSNNVETLWLSGTAVTGSGNSGDNGLLGNNLNNVLNGGAGNDSLNGSLGNDTMSGGTGNDIYTVEQTGDVVIEASNAGFDEVLASVTYTLAANLENLTLMGAGDGTGNGANNVISGSSTNNSLSGLGGNDTLWGVRGNDTLSGGDGDDVLDGGIGIDAMAGGLGNDQYYVDSLGDTVNEAVNAGLDEIFATVSVTLPGAVENLTVLSGDVFGFGNNLANRLLGSSGDNILDGQDGNDTLYGLGGNDSLFGGADDDAMDGGDGNDALNGGVGVNQVYGGTGDDTLFAGDSVFGVAAGILDGGDGNDLLDLNGNTAAIALNLATGASSFGSTTITGFENLTSGAGSDSIVGTDGANAIDVNGGNDTVFAGLGNDTITGGDGNDLLDGGDGDNRVLGGNGNDTVIGSISGYNVLLDGGDGYDMVDVSPFGGDYVIDMVTGGTNYGESIVNFEALTSGGGNDAITGTIADNQISVNGGNDTVHAGDGADLVIGGEGMDLLLGEGGEDLLFGQDGDDSLDGGAGHDQIYAGSGNDTVTIADGDDGLDTVDGEDGIDFLDAGAITYNLVLNLSDGSTNVAATFAGFEGVSTGSGVDMITGTDGVDYILTNGGNDWLNGGLGTDFMLGGAGNDTYVYTPGDLMMEAADGGYDAVRSDYSMTLATNFENLVLTGGDAVNGTGNALNNSLTGNDAANTLTGLAGTDLLDGGAGADTLVGGADNDSYIVDNVGDVVTEVGGQGNDVVFASVTYTMGASIEVLNLTGVANIDGTGNSNDNILNGNDGNNSLDGKAGADTMTGGAGDDTYYVSDAGDRVVEGDVIGIDTVFTSISYSAAGQYVENLTLTGSDNLTLLGNGVNNILRGNAGNNDLNGSAGADTLIGGAGSDTYTVDNVGDVVTETGSPGIDVVNSRVSFDIGTQYIEIVNLTFNGNVNAYGSTTSRGETLNGNNANNILDGRSGADTMAGGIGNDTYNVDNAGDMVIENANEGIDSVRSFLSYTLGANIETLELQGAGNLTGTGTTTDNTLLGNTGNNRLFGLDGNDWLDGREGNDTMTGGVGNDTYVVDTAADVINELANQGTDTVIAAYSYTLGATLDNLTLTGSGNINATGNAAVNILTGNGGINVLDGGAGADTMIGGQGDDSYYVDDSGDIATELNGQGTDTVFASVSYVLGATSYIDILTLTGSSAINGTGNGAVNTLNGNGGANLLDGAAGNDILTGGAGNDTLIGGNGADAFVFGLGSGQDVINDFKSGQNDTLNLHAYSNGVAFGGGITLTAQGSNTLINLGGGNNILVMNIVPTDNNFLSHIVW